jgi:hypothetical protein
LISENLSKSEVGRLSLKPIMGNRPRSKTATATVSGTIGQLYYNKYNYQNLALKGK